MIRTIAAFVVAVVVTTSLATIASTQFVLARLVALGADVPLGVRIETTVHDLLGMGPLYGALTAVAFVIAMPVAALIVRYLLPSWRPVAYPLAGAVAVLCMLLLLETVLGMMPIAGARSAMAAGLHVLAGALGGYVLLRLLPEPAARDRRAAAAG